MSDYPKLMRHTERGVIVRFTAYGVGIVVGKGHGGMSNQNVGYHSIEWYMGAFKDYKPEVFTTKKEEV